MRHAPDGLLWSVAQLLHSENVLIKDWWNWIMQIESLSEHILWLTQSILCWRLPVGCDARVRISSLRTPKRNIQIFVLQNYVCAEMCWLWVTQVCTDPPAHTPAQQHHQCLRRSRNPKSNTFESGKRRNGWNGWRHPLHATNAMPNS